MPKKFDPQLRARAVWLVRNHADQYPTLTAAQAAVAKQVGVSRETIRRWTEQDDTDAGAKPGVTSMESTEIRHLTTERRSEQLAENFVKAWGDSNRLTSRQAYAISVELASWIDTDIGPWLRDPSEPLHEVAPFDRFDLRVMMLVGESRAWAEVVLHRCGVLYDEIEAGVLPFDRPGPLIDEVLIGAALDGARTWLQDVPELFRRIPPREAVEGDDEDAFLIGDDDWDTVFTHFDNECRWDEWQVPLVHDHPLLPAVLAERHPYRWFDAGEPSGPGYLQRLVGLVVEDTASGSAPVPTQR